MLQSIAGQKNLVQQQGLATAKLLNQPSISITPLPRQGSANQPAASQQQQVKPGRPPTSAQKGQFVICEICDGYIKVCLLFTVIFHIDSNVEPFYIF